MKSVKTIMLRLAQASMQAKETAFVLPEHTVALVSVLARMLITVNPYYGVLLNVK